MRDPSGLNRGYWLGLALVALVGVFLAIRSERAVRAVLDTRQTALAQAPAAGGSAAAKAEEARKKEEMLAAAMPTERDPFRDQPAPRAMTEAEGTEPRPQGREAPICTGLLYDNVSPLVQLTAGQQTSGWLRKGEQFQSWTVAEITSRSVKIESGGRSVLLHSP